MTQTIRVINNKPTVSLVQVPGVGPAGAVTTSDGGQTEEQVNTLIAAHNDRTTPHTNATSGRDFAALFQNGLT